MPLTKRLFQKCYIKIVRQKGFALPLIIGLILVVSLLSLSYWHFVIKTKVQTPIKIVKQKDDVGNKNTANWKSYSNGWYNYTFKYPADKEIRYYGRSSQPYSLMDSVISVWPECILTVNYGSKPTVSTEGEKTQEIIKDGQKWEEYYLIHQKDSPLYERQASARLTQKDSLNYIFASLDSAKGKFSTLCEDIFSTFRFGIDENSQSAKEAKQAKEAALVYSKEKLPGYNFAGGVFRFLPPLPSEPTYPKNEELLRSSNRAFVDFVKNDIRSLELDKNGDWKVAKETFGGQKTESETSTILWEDSTVIF